MISKLLTSAFKVRVVLWAARCLAPSKQDIEQSIKDSLLAIAALVLCMLLISFALVGLLVLVALSLYYYAQLNLVATLAISFALLGVAIVGLYAFASIKLQKASNIRHKSRVPRRSDNSLRAIVDGFAEGYNSTPMPAGRSESTATDDKVTPIRAA